jgi:ketosteroid isomerase-like protein
VLPVLISGVTLFAPANAQSVSSPKAFGGKRADHTSAVTEIRSVLRMQQDAWNHGDIDRFMNGYAHSEHTVFVSEDTVRRGWGTVRDRYREKYSDRARMGVLTFSDLEIVLLSPDSAVVLGRWKLQRAKDRPHGRFTLIFRRLPEGWRIAHDHTSAADFRRPSSFSWMLSNPPLLKTTTTSFAFSIGTIRSTIAAASFS